MMTHHSTAFSVVHIKIILVIGLVAGTLDIVAALVVYQVPPVTLLQGIASGAVGREEAFSGGLLMAGLGLLIHYFIAMFWTALFFVIYPKIGILKRKIVITGLLYGVVVWMGMNLLVLPYLSRIPQGPFNLPGALTGMAILMVMVGLPVAILTHRYHTGKKLFG